MGSFTDILQTSNRRFSKLTAKPFKFLQSGEELTEDFKLLAKVVYDLGKLSEKDSDGKEGGNGLLWPPFSCPINCLMMVKLCYNHKKSQN
jgi:hypothetical protein